MEIGMTDVLDAVQGWIGRGDDVALATVIATERSAPHDPGATMAVCGSGEVVGSVSGGCVEGAVVEEALRVLATGVPRRLSYGISDELGRNVGLTCGGRIHLFVERLDWKEAFGDAAASIRSGEPVSLVTELEGPHPGTKLVVRPDSALGRLEPPALQKRVVSDARAMLEADLTGVRRWGSHGEARREDVELFVQSFATVPRMYVFGATDFAQATARMGKFLGYHVTVCDARATFATRLRFPDADELVVRWPDEFLADAPVDSRTAICVLTHDPKFDVPLLRVALGTEAAYIGAMGSRRTDDERAASLRQAGVDEQQMARIRGPVGLDIGARTAQEVAVAIAAEIIALRYGAPGRFLHDRRGAVHRSPEVDLRAVAAASA